MNLGNLKVLIGADIDPLLKNLKKAEKALHTTGRNFQNIGNGMMKLAAPFAAVGAAGAKMAIDFDDSMRKVRATMGASQDDFKKLREAAMKAGETTRFSASQSATALNYMALAGWNAEKSISALPGVLNLAAASGEDLGLVSDIVTDGMTAFGLAAENATKFADLLAQAASSSNTTVAMLGDAFKYAAPMAGALGFAAEDTAFALGLMANAGVKGSMAGTSLSAMMTRMVKPTKESAEAMKELGLQVTNSDGSMVPLRDILEQLREKFSTLTESERGMYAGMLAGQEAMKGLLAITNASSESFDDLGNKIDNADGKALDMAKIMEGGLGGAIRSLKSLVESAMISFGEAFGPVIENAIDNLKSAVKWFNGLSAETKQSIANITLWTLGIGVAFKGIGMLISGVSGAISMFGSFLKIMKSVRIAILAVNAALIANPIGLIIAAVAALIALIVIIIKKYETWGAAITLLFGPIGMLINLIMSFARHWDSIVDAFKSDGIIAGLKRIGLVILDALLYPIQQLLQLASKIPGIGDLAGKAAAKIEGLRNKLNLITPAKEAPRKQGQGFYDFMQAGTASSGSGSSGSTAPAPGASGGSGAGGSSGGSGAGTEKVSQLVSKLSGGNEMTSWIDDATKKLSALDQIKNRLSDTSALKNGMVDAFKAIIPAVKETGEEIEYSLADKLEMLGDKVKGLAGKFLEMVEKIAPLVGQLQETFGALFDYQSAKIEDNYNKQKAAIEGGVGDEETKAAAILALDEKTNKERRKLARKEAIANKAFAIYNAAVNVAVGVTKALSAGPILGPILAALVAGLGAVQIGLIAAKPLPALAEGGLAFGQTQAIVGDNPNARVDPEVIAPLSKLKSMLGNAGNAVVVNLEGAFRMNGNDLMLVVQKAEANQLRSRGYNG